MPRSCLRLSMLLLSSKVLAGHATAAPVRSLTPLDPLTVLNDRIEYLFDREHQIGHAYFTRCESTADVEGVMRHNVIPLLAEYFYEDWAKIALVLGDKPDGSKQRFVQAKRLVPPGFEDSDDNGDAKIRWSVKKNFDFTEFMRP